MDNTYEFHDLSLRFPQMADAELAALAADMATPGNGMIDPITLYQGKILDGRNRYQAWQLPVCQEAGVELKTTPYTGDSPLAFVVSKNVPRRHLSSSQAAALAVELLPELEEEFKAHQRLGRAELPDPDRSGKAVDFAARLTGTCGRQVQDAKKVKSSVPELIEFIRAGELSVGGAKSLATAITKLPAKKKEKIMGLFGKGVKAIREALKTAKPAVPSIVRSLTALEKKDDDSVEIFLTNEGTYSRIAEAARAKLTPDGVCLVYCDQGSIPAAAAEIQKQLPYSVRLCGM